jgi:hypothetical protein
MDFPTMTGCVVNARLIGCMRAKQEEKDKRTVRYVPICRSTISHNANNDTASTMIKFGFGYGHLWENTEDDLKAVAEMEKRLLA